MSRNHRRGFHCFYTMRSSGKTAWSTVIKKCGSAFSLCSTNMFAAPYSQHQHSQEGAAEPQMAATQRRYPSKAPSPQQREGPDAGACWVQDHRVFLFILDPVTGQHQCSDVLVVTSQWSPPMHHIQVFTCIYRSQSSSRLNINYATSGHGWVIESKPSAIGIEDGCQESNKGKTPPRTC